VNFTYFSQVKDRETFRERIDDFYAQLKLSDGQSSHRRSPPATIEKRRARRTSG
jgi:hypothetical protein